MTDVAIILGCCLLWYLLSRIDTRLEELQAAVERLTKAVSPPLPKPSQVPSESAASVARRRAEERTEHNREVRRRMKIRKAAAIEAQREENLDRTVKAVLKSQEQEKVWRAQVAAERGWDVHPNDVD